jgi:hypothetical protein
MLNRTLRDLLWLGSFLAVAGYIFVAVSRIIHPVPPDPTEALILEHAARFARLEPLYSSETADRRDDARISDGGLALRPALRAPARELRVMSLIAALATPGSRR